MAKKKVKLGLNKLTVPAKLTMGETVVTSLTGHPTLTTPDPPLASVTTRINALRQKHQTADLKRREAVQATTELVNEEKQFDDTMTALAGYVERASNGDQATIESAGMQTRAAPSPVGPPGQVQNLSAAGGDHEGEVDLNWQPVPKAQRYEAFRSANVMDPQSWQRAGSTTKSKYTAKNLQSGTIYWFRVRALGTGEDSVGPWSDPAIARAS